MHDDIIAQNLNYLDKKLIIDNKKDLFQIINGVKYRVIYVSREFEKVICPVCGSVVSKIKDYHLRKVKVFFNYDYPTLLFYKQRRLQCDCGKTINENNTFIEKGKTISNYLKLQILKQCKYKESFTTIAQQLGVNTSTVINTFMESANFKRREFTEVLCVDEFSAHINPNNTFACIIGDPESKEILDILPSRHQSYLENYLSKIDKNERIKVKIINIDMWKPYRSSFSAYFPFAKICVDPFHWIRKATDCFNKLRVDIAKHTSDTKLSRLLFSYWKSICKNEVRLYNNKRYNSILQSYVSEREIVEYCINSDLIIEHAWLVLQRIYKFRDKCNKNNCKDELASIISELKSIDNDYIKSIAVTYEEWFTEICNSFETYGKYNSRCSNAFSEGKNRLCKEIKAFSCGFQNFDIYRARILYISAKTPIPFSTIDPRRKVFKKSRKHKK